MERGYLGVLAEIIGDDASAEIQGLLYSSALDCAEKSGMLILFPDDVPQE